MLLTEVEDLPYQRWEFKSKIATFLIPKAAWQLTSWRGCRQDDEPRLKTLVICPVMARDKVTRRVLPYFKVHASQKTSSSYKAATTFEFIWQRVKTLRWNVQVELWQYRWNIRKNVTWSIDCDHEMPFSSCWLRDLGLFLPSPLSNLLGSLLWLT